MYWKTDVKIRMHRTPQHTNNMKGLIYFCEVNFLLCHQNPFPDTLSRGQYFVTELNRWLLGYCLAIRFGLHERDVHYCDCYTETVDWAWAGLIG